MTTQVLILEDEKILANNLATALARVGVSSHVAGSIAEASRRLFEQDYDLICADIQLGDGNGLAFCEEARLTRPSLPIIVMTGQDTSGNRLRSEEFGATAFVAKPFSLSRFRELVATLLREFVAPVEKQQRDSAPRVLMYSHDTIGLGHMRRNSAIAARIVASNPRASVLMLVGSPSGLFFDLPPGVDYIKLPSLAKVAREVWRPQSLRITSGEVLAMRSGLIERAVDTFKPHVFLVDHEANGVWNELNPALELLRRSNPETRIILGLRDILDEPSQTLQSWSKRGTTQTIQRFYDDILVYGDEALFPTREAYGLDKLVPGHVHSCGYVTNVDSAAKKPKKDGSAKKRIVVAGGGGRDAFPLLAAAVEALRAMPEHERPHADIIAGPLMDSDLFVPLDQSSAAVGINFHRTHPNVPGLLASADLFVTMGGYNSVVEAIAVGCPTLVVPRVGPSAEQRMRADCMKAKGLVSVLNAHDADVPGLRAALKSLLQKPLKKSGAAINFKGAEFAADFIAQAIEAGTVSNSKQKMPSYAHA
jgi:predicted glycosyltransferase